MTKNLLATPFWTAALLCVLTAVGYSQESEGRLLADVRGGSSIIFIGAHPDDEILVGPLLARACRDYGNRCVMVSLSKGERGCKPDWPCGKALAAVRTLEYETFASLMGAQAVIADYEDSTQGGRYSPGSPDRVIADWSRQGDVRDFVRSVIAAHDPDIVITLEPTNGMTGHPDHKAVSKLVSEAVLGEADAKPRRLYYALNRYASLFGQRLDPLPATDVIDAAEISAKLGTSYKQYFLEALKVYVSQDVYGSVSHVTETSTWLRQVPR